MLGQRPCFRAPEIRPYYGLMAKYNAEISGSAALTANAVAPSCDICRNRLPPRLDFAYFHRLAMSSADAGAETLLQSALNQTIVWFEG